MRKGVIQKRKKPLRFFCLIFACVALTGCASAAGENVPAKQKDQESVTVGSFTDNKNGTVSFSYNNVNKERYKVVTQKEGGRNTSTISPPGSAILCFLCPREMAVTACTFVRILPETSIPSWNP